MLANSQSLSSCIIPSQYFMPCYETLIFIAYMYGHSSHFIRMKTRLFQIRNLAYVVSWTCKIQLCTPKLEARISNMITNLSSVYYNWCHALDTNLLLWYIITRCNLPKNLLCVLLFENISYLSLARGCTANNQFIFWKLLMIIKINFACYHRLSS
jgi:hypothetical protein